MSTLGIMKARIASDLRRSDLTAQIADAVATAIAAYQHERFGFSESRSLTFSTIVDQEFYSASDVPNLAKIRRIDNVHIGVSGNMSKLDPISQDEVEGLSQDGTQRGDPLYYSWYARQFRLYPIPTMVYTVRIAGHVAVAAPASDVEIDNPWMTDAERLIRSRAKYEIALHVLRDEKLAQAMTDAVLEAENQLIILANREKPSSCTIDATRF